MYIHLGEDDCVRDCEIVGIFDIDNCTVGARTKKLLERGSRENVIVYVGEELPKSFALCHRQTAGESIRILGVSTATIKKRARRAF